MPFHPLSAGGLVHGLHRSPHRILARHPGHSQQLRIDAVAPDRVDVGVPPMTGEHRQQQSSQYIPLLRRVPTGVVQRAILYPFVEPATDLQKLDEEWHQAQATHRGVWHELHMNLAREGVQAGNGFCRLISCDLDLTLRVSLNEICFFAHVEPVSYTHLTLPTIYSV